MTAKARLTAQLRGESIDRPPIYTQIPFGVSDAGLVPKAFHGYDDYDDWRAQDPLYREIVRRMETDCDNAFIWRAPCMQNLQFAVSPDETRTLPAERNGERVRFVTEVDLGGRVLREIREVKPGSGHSWQIEHLCKDPSDASLLLQRNWHGIAPDIDDFFEMEQRLGDCGVMWVTIPSPIMVVCKLFDPTEFLVYVRTEAPLINDLLSMVQKRIYSNLEYLIEHGAGPVIRFGGAEQATPPLMSPDDFDRLVVEVDQPLVDLCRKNGRFVAYHCHGNIRHALKRFREMGVRQTDPTESVPDGDVTNEEAREIAGSDVILAGNVECREMFSDSVEVNVIRDRVRTYIREAGPDHIVVTTTGSIIERVSPMTAKKYHAMIDEVLAVGS